MNKIVIDKGYLNELINKNWQDIENLQRQINSLSDEDIKTVELKKLLNNLLTSYYVFTGCVENSLANFDNSVYSDIINQSTLNIKSDAINEIETDAEDIINPIDSNVNSYNNIASKDDFEPFEYFVDFDEPVGEKPTDEDIAKFKI